MEKNAILSRLAPSLLAWYRENARDLPWRRTRDPYRIWVSEIMLQQTRVAAVLGYYRRFLEAFPTVETLAEGEEERLLALWQGLGYYSRARNLQRAAREITLRGAFPDTAEGLRALPGIGEYTAGAIASAAFGRRVPAVDGNVLRVVSRLTDCHGDVQTPTVKRAVWELVAASFPEGEEEARVYNQALMELGAVVCVPNGPPRCAVCPAAEVCLARARGTAEALPVRAAKRERHVEERTVFVLLCEGRMALRKRAARGLLAGLWEFPNRSGTLDEAGAADSVHALGYDVVEWHNCLTAKHLFTHVEWRMTGYVLTVRAREDAEPDSSLVWVSPAELDGYAIPSAFARFRESAVERLTRSETGVREEGVE